jgi:hypothetical protein
MMAGFGHSSTSLFSQPIKRHREDDTTRKVKAALGDFHQVQKFVVKDHTSLIGISKQEVERIKRTKEKVQSIFSEMRLDTIKGLDEDEPEDEDNSRSVITMVSQSNDHQIRQSKRPEPSLPPRDEPSSWNLISFIGNPSIPVSSSSKFSNQDHSDHLSCSSSSKSSEKSPVHEDMEEEDDNMSSNQNSVSRVVCPEEASLSEEGFGRNSSSSEANDNIKSVDSQRPVSPLKESPKEESNTPKRTTPPENKNSFSEVMEDVVRGNYSHTSSSSSSSSSESSSSSSSSSESSSDEEEGEIKEDVSNDRVFNRRERERSSTPRSNATSTPVNEYSSRASSSTSSHENHSSNSNIIPTQIIVSISLDRLKESSSLPSSSPKPSSTSSKKPPVSLGAKKALFTNNNVRDNVKSPIVKAENPPSNEAVKVKEEKPLDAFSNALFAAAQLPAKNGHSKNRSSQVVNNKKEKEQRKDIKKVERKEDSKDVKKESSKEDKKKETNDDKKEDRHQEKIQDKHKDKKNLLEAKDAVTPDKLIRNKNDQVNKGKDSSPQSTPHQQYLASAKKLKHEADKESDRVLQMIKYIDAVLHFILSTHVMESSQGPKESLRIYKDTFALLRHVTTCFKKNQSNSNDNVSTDHKLTALSYRIHCLLMLKMSKLNNLLRNKELRDNQKLISQAPEVPTSKEVKEVSIPVNVYSAMKNQLSLYSDLHAAHEYWYSADFLIDKYAHCKAFFGTIDLKSGVLSISSTFDDLVAYVRTGLQLIR